MSTDENHPPTAPVAFIAHSECDDAFCHELYDALCRLGVRPIMDKRDFKPGDDLVKRVFDQGIAKSDGVIFVLSPGSVDRPWLRKELSVSVVHEIAARTRLIPILLNALPDDRVPPPLAATIWIRVGPDTTSDEVASRIASVLHSDQQTNPTVAAPPAWTREAVAKMYGLSAMDEVLFKFICDRRMESTHPLVSTAHIVDYALAQDIPEADIETAFAVLRDSGYTEPGISAMGGSLPNAVRPSRFGITKYLEAYRAEEYATAFPAVVAALVNGRASDLHSLCLVLGTPEPLLDHILDVLDSEGDIRALRSMGGHVAWHVNPTLRRRLR